METAVENEGKRSRKLGSGVDTGCDERRANSTTTYNLLVRVLGAYAFIEKILKTVIKLRGGKKRERKNESERSKCSLFGWLYVFMYTPKGQKSGLS